jgi:hypothetical protein
MSAKQLLRWVLEGRLRSVDRGISPSVSGGRSHGARTGADRANDTLAAKHLDRWLVRAQVVDLPAPLVFSGSARQRPAMAGWPAAMG